MSRDWLPIEEQDRNALVAGTSGTTRTMHVGIHITRRVKLNDKINVLNINTTGSNVSGNQNIECTLTEGSESGIALLLSNIPV
jgi:hypothetical protein